MCRWARSSRGCFGRGLRCAKRAGFGRARMAGRWRKIFSPGHGPRACWIGVCDERESGRTSTAHCGVYRRGIIPGGSGAAGGLPGEYGSGTGGPDRGDAGGQGGGAINATAAGAGGFVGPDYGADRAGEFAGQRGTPGGAAAAVVAEPGGDRGGVGAGAGRVYVFDCVVGDAAKRKELDCGDEYASR